MTEETSKFSADMLDDDFFNSIPPITRNITKEEDRITIRDNEGDFAVEIDLDEIKSAEGILNILNQIALKAYMTDENQVNICGFIKVACDHLNIELEPRGRY